MNKLEIDPKNPVGLTSFWLSMVYERVDFSLVSAVDYRLSEIEASFVLSLFFAFSLPN